VEGISTAATVAGDILLTAGTGTVAYGIYDSVSGGGGNLNTSNQPQIGTNVLGLPGMLGSNQSESNGPWSEQPPFPLSPTSPSWVPYSNGLIPVAAGVGALGGGAICMGSGVCEVVGVAIAAGTVAYGAYELGKLIGPHFMFSKGGKQNVGETGLWERRTRLALRTHAVG
jgi:hypothetical protein